LQGAPLISVGGIEAILPQKVEIALVKAFKHHELSSLSELLKNYEDYIWKEPIPKELLNWITKFKGSNVNLSNGNASIFDLETNMMYSNIIFVPNVQVDSDRDLFQKEFEEVRNCWFYSLDPIAKFSFRIVEGNHQLEDELMTIGTLPVGSLIDLYVIPIGHDLQGTPHLYAKSVKPSGGYDFPSEPTPVDFVAAKG